MTSRFLAVGPGSTESELHATIGGKVLNCSALKPWCSEGPAANGTSSVSTGHPGPSPQHNKEA